MFGILTSHHFSGSSPFSVFLFVLLVIKLPLDHSLVTGSGKEELNAFAVDLFLTNSEGGNPAAVAYKRA